jgi:hypothetical protein
MLNVWFAGRQSDTHPRCESSGARFLVLTASPERSDEYISMTNSDVIHAAEALGSLPAAGPTQEQTCLHHAFCLARYIEGRRRELNLLIQRAAELAGMEFSQWCALEGGWIAMQSRMTSCHAMNAFFGATTRRCCPGCSAVHV